MLLEIKIGWRNIFRHKGRSLVICAIIFIGAFIMTIGNAVVAGMDKGIEDNIVNRFFGHMMIMSTNQESDSPFGEGMGLTENFVLPNYPGLKAILQKESNVEAFLPGGIGFVMGLNDSGNPDFSLIMGIDFQEYQAVFKTNIVLVEGKELKPGERGVLFTTRKRKNAYTMQGYWIVSETGGLVRSNLDPEALSNINTLILRSNIVVMGASSGSVLDVRLPVRGLVRFKNMDAMFGDDVNLVDMESFREAMGFFKAEDTAAEVSDMDLLLLGSGDADLSLDTFVPADLSSKTGFDMRSLKEETKKERISDDVDRGSFTTIFVRLKNGKNLSTEVAKYNTLFREKGIGAKAVPWNKAAGNIGTMTGAIRIILVVFVLFLYFVAAIVIMNTLSMTAIERVNEIGMMRAVGAPKSFISGMFFFETLFLALSAGAAAVIAAVIATHVLASAGITSDNEMVQLLFGGDTFQPSLGSTDIVMSVVLLLCATALSVVYPIALARRITPLEAIAKD